MTNQPAYMYDDQGFWKGRHTYGGDGLHVTCGECGCTTTITAEGERTIVAELATPVDRKTIGCKCGDIQIVLRRTIIERSGQSLCILEARQQLTNPLPVPAFGTGPTGVK